MVGLKPIWNWKDGGGIIGEGDPEGELTWIELRVSDFGEAGERALEAWAGNGYRPTNGEAVAFLIGLLDPDVKFPVPPAPEALWEGLLIRLGGGIMSTNSQESQFAVDRRRRLLTIRPTRNIGRYIGQKGRNIGQINEILARIGWRAEIRS